MIETLFSLKGRVCVVTGGSRGLGKHMAQGFLEAGAAVVYITARSAEACEDTAKELSRFGECVALPGDIAPSAGIAELVRELRARESHLDVLVNNAGSVWRPLSSSFPKRVGTA